MATTKEINARLSALPDAMREGFARRLSGAARIADRRRRARVLAEIESAVETAITARVARTDAVPKKIAYPAELPITDRRDELLSTIRNNQVVIVAGETGSGKSTQLPKMCLELGRGIDGRIAHTQPRRIAARSIAERVAEELNSQVGGLVGYSVRFTDEVGSTTAIRLMTDGILLNEIQRDRMLWAYDTIIIDEAHERSLNIDFLLGYLKQLLPSRPDLKLIVTSATIDTERFSAHFDDAPVVEVSGRTYPVEVRYRPLVDPDGVEDKDQVQGICDAVSELTGEGRGDILVFCSGEREIRDTVDALGEMRLNATEILPLYGRLSAGEQHRVFSPARGRRIVVATNVAETSLTVPGIRYVIDPGTARISRYSRRTKVQRLPIEAISQASANQRAGRCGRLGPGIAIRLYDETDYESRPAFTEPEVLRTNLASVILQMAAIGLGDVEAFPFVEPPDTRAIRDGVNLLEELGAVDPGHQGTKRWLTKLGRQLSRLPLDPRLARMLIEADDRACVREVLIIAAALSIQDPKERPVGQEAQAEQSHARFRDPNSDFLSWLRLWEYIQTQRKDLTSSRFRRMCRDEFLHYRRIREWQDVHGQLRDVAKELGLRRNRQPADPESIHRALMAGLLSHLGRKEPKGHEYRGARGAVFAISPASTLFKANPEWVMAAELVETSRLWAHSVARIDPAWAESAGGHLLKRSFSDPWWDAKRGAAVAHETVTLYGLTLVTDRTVQYGRIDPAAARQLFIEHVLVAGEWDSRHPFVEHNAAVINEVLAMEARERRSDLLVDDDTVVDWFAQRIPDDIISTRHFDNWWKDARHDNPGLLALSVDDLLDPDAAPVDESAFPQVWSYGDLELPINYEFDPSSRSDGITIDVPLAALDRVDPDAFEWQVPGLRNELVIALVRSLPKRLRKQFVPIPETVHGLMDGLDPSEGGLIEAVRRELTRLGGVPVMTEDFQLDALPHHLSPRYRVVDAAGETIAEGDDLAQIREGLREAARATIDDTAHGLERSGATTWDFGEIPAYVRLGEAGNSVIAYPALVDEGKSVGLRLLATEDEQADAMWAGTRRLLLLQLPSAVKLLRPLLTNEAKLALATGPYDGPGDWMEDVLAAAVTEQMAEAAAPAWDAVGFDRLLEAVRIGLGESVAAIGGASLEALATLRRVQTALDSPAMRLFDDARTDIEDQLDRFIYPGFLTGVGAGRVRDVARYVAAVERRIERIGDDPGRDLELMGRVWALQRRLDNLMDQLPFSPEMIDIAWMIQELRVSLFAQQLGVRGTISEKRIRRALDELLGLEFT